MFDGDIVVFVFCFRPRQAELLGAGRRPAAYRAAEVLLDRGDLCPYPGSHGSINGAPLVHHGVTREVVHSAGGPLGPSEAATRRGPGI